MANPYLRKGIVIPAVAIVAVLAVALVAGTAFAQEQNKTTAVTWLFSLHLASVRLSFMVDYGMNTIVRKLAPPSPRCPVNLQHRGLHSITPYSLIIR